MTGRFTTGDYLGAFRHGLWLLIKHRGRLSAVEADLTAERDRDRAAARRGDPHG